MGQNCSTDLRDRAAFCRGSLFAVSGGAALWGQQQLRGEAVAVHDTARFIDAAGAEPAAWQRKACTASSVSDRGRGRTGGVSAYPLRFELHERHLVRFCAWRGGAFVDRFKHYWRFRRERRRIFRNAYGYSTHGRDSG